MQNAEGRMQNKMRGQIGVLIVLAVAGCGQGLNKEESFTVGPRGNGVVWSEPASRERKILAEVTSSGESIDLSVVLSATPEGSLKVVEKQQGSHIVARVLDKQSHQVEAIIPAGWGFAVVVSNPGFQKTDVTVKIKGE